MIEQAHLKTDIEVDGGVTLQNVGELLEVGANIIVAGSAVFSGDITDNVTQFLAQME
jgi:ribulose-phosphate 3-epimerase